MNFKNIWSSKLSYNVSSGGINDVGPVFVSQDLKQPLCFVIPFRGTPSKITAASGICTTMKSTFRPVIALSPRIPAHLKRYHRKCLNQTLHTAGGLVVEHSEGQHQ